MCCAVGFAGVILIVLFGGAGARAQDGGTPAVAYIYDGALWLWHAGETQRIAEGDIYKVALAPGGGRIAYASTDALWMAAGRAARMVAELDALHRVHQVAWLTGDVLYFNTQVMSEGEMVGVEYADDLWRVDAGEDTDNVTQLLASGAGGQFVLAPDGEHIALVTPGVYGDADRPGAISIVDPMGGNRVNIFSYPAISTGSQYAFYLVPHWLPGGAALRVAVPDPDAVYALEDAPPVALWEITLDGSAEKIGEAPADYFSILNNRAFWSPDGERFAYMKRVGSLGEDRMALCVAAVGTGDAMCLEEGTIGGLVPIDWTPGGDLIYREDVEYSGIMWQVAPGEEPQRFPGEPAYVAFTWVDANTYVYMTQSHVLDSWGKPTYLKFAQPGKQAQTIAEFEDGAWPEFSAVSVP
ncbi:MAG: hypothetical protein JXB47_00975 [Anaerolineae bacterium]|nr:hypothetical protein [Anaerolineae bacterium]